MGRQDSTAEDPDPHDEGRERLERIQVLWDELRAAPRYSPKYEGLMQRIRREADAFRQRLD
jgi:hypothetical protein